VILTTLTTAAGIIPTAYGWAGYDAMLAQMMLALAWGLIFGTTITLILIPCIYSVIMNTRVKRA
jgi:multidrug efflux pump subunit AcrB